MITAAGFWLFLLSALSIVGVYGDHEACAFGVSIFAATILTALAMCLSSATIHALVVFGIDALLLLFALILAGRSRAYWPIWFAGFHSITVATELARQIFPSGIPAIYGNAAALWSMPALATMAIGVMLDNRARLNQARAHA